MSEFITVIEIFKRDILNIWYDIWVKGMIMLIILSKSPLIRLRDICVSPFLFTYDGTPEGTCEIYHIYYCVPSQ